MDLRKLFFLDPEVVFLNHGSFGATPLPVFEEYQAWQRRLETQPVKFLSRELGDHLRAVRHELGEYLGAAAQNLVFVPNVTTGVNAVARSLPLQPGDEILGSDHEYGACHKVWQFVCGKTGAVYRRQPVPLPVETAEAVVARFWQGVTERTRVIFLSHITSPTALRLPVEAICRRARTAGIWTVIDGAHAPGQIALDVPAVSADFYAGNLHKWALSPKGAGFLCVRPECQALMEPLVVSWGWGNAPPYRTGSAFLEQFDWVGTVDPSAYLAVPAAIRFQAEHDWSRVRRDCHSLLREARQQVEALAGLPPICPDSDEWYGQMAALPLPPCDAAALQRRLYDVNRVEVPIVDWGGQQFVRVSIQAYNTAEDIGSLVSAVSELLPQCRG